MCDTIVAVKKATRNNVVLIAKNSDRDENEAHIMVKVEAKTNDLKQTPMVQTTNLLIPQVKKTNAIALLKPEWLWGCEMGFNEFGLNICNEAVFTKEKYQSEGLLGMDIMRLVLERCKTAREGVNYIAWLLEEYGQGGNCKKPGHGKFNYHNTFILADQEMAWVFETSGKYWVAKKVEDIYSVSNRLTITTDFDLAHPEVIENAIRKGYCKRDEIFNFARAYTNKLVSWFAKGKDRKCLSESLLNNYKGDLTIDNMKSILRAHPENFEGKQFSNNTMKSVCMHGGPGVSSHSTGSYVAELTCTINNYLVTGSSTPCISVFKPVWFESDVFISENQQMQGIKYWLKREKIHRLILENKIDSKLYTESSRKLEDKLKNIGSKLNSDSTVEDYNKIVKKCFELDEKLVDDFLETKKCKGRYRGSILFNNFWRKKSKALEKEVY